VIPEELYCVGDLVKLHQDLFYNYSPPEPFQRAGQGSAYYTIGGSPDQIGIIVDVVHHEHLLDPDLCTPYAFIYKVFWSGGIGYTREQHVDLCVISYSSPRV
jgi:hypothetical protein